MCRSALERDGVFSKKFLGSWGFSRINWNGNWFRGPGILVRNCCGFLDWICKTCSYRFMWLITKKNSQMTWIQINRQIVLAISTLVELWHGKHQDSLRKTNRKSGESSKWLKIGLMYWNRASWGCLQTLQIFRSWWKAGVSGSCAFVWCLDSLV